MSNLSFKRFDPVNRCIYCRRTAEESGSPLTEEHIIARSLGGRLFLPSASCGDCQRAIHAYEGRCAGQMLCSARQHLKLPRNKSSKKKPWPDPQILYPDGKGGYSVFNLPFDQWPPILMFPRFARCTFLQNLPPANTSMLIAVKAYVFPGFLEKYAALPAGAAFGQRFDPSDVCRMFAKIAHGITVAHYGLDGFEPFLPDIILGKSDQVFHYVGGTDENPPFAGSGLHAVSIFTRPSDQMIRVLVQLFAKYGGPVFEAVPGRRRS